LSVVAAILGRMCGIAGTAGGRPDRAQLKRMALTMRKRGPDGEGVWLDERAGIAARRLAIIDLHERSNQPLHLGSLHLVFNGEVYNYKELRDELRGLGHEFETEGDAEVLLHAWSEWGERALERVNAMFALAIWDDANGTLTLASDPFGEKPLYYALRGERIVFASEIKALFHDPDVTPVADDTAVAMFLMRGTMPPVDESFFVGIRRLPAAHVLSFRDGRAQVRRYWQPALVEVSGNYADAVAELRALLVDSIRLRLRSDVPIGTSLSGGIDSSTVVMLSSELAGDHTRHVFTARFPGWERDEWRYADEVARRAGVVEHHVAEPTVDEVIADLPQLVVDHEEPVGSLSIYAQWRVNQAAKAAGVMVLLDGQGGDELFGGYPATIGWLLRGDGVRGIGRGLRTGGGRSRLLESYAYDYLPDPLRRLHFRRTSSPYASAGAVAAALAAPIRTPTPWFRGGGAHQRQLVTQSFETSLPQLLRYADRSSMAWSREVRLPYLDRRITELALSLPARYLYADGVMKRVLRDVGRGLVPDSVLDRTDKIGFEPPQKTWLETEPFRAAIAEVLLDPRARSRGLYAADAIEQDLASGSWRDDRALWRTLNVEMWLRELVESPLAESVALQPTTA
jgi:asparagine synthase (glutamine-hydrolysing)